jgi:hypothetical protein
LAGRSSSLASQLPHLDWGQAVGDWLAGRSSSLASQAPTFGLGVGSWRLVGWQVVFAGKPSSHIWIGGRQLEIGWLAGRLRWQAKLPQGSSLIRQSLVGCQAATYRFAPPPLNRMSVSSAAAFDLKVRRQAEWRDLSGGGRAAPFGAAKCIERRCSEANRRRCPRMKPGAKEPRAPASGPNVRVKPFGLPFRRLEKVTRRKGGTLSSRYRSNGYTPKKNAPIQRPGHPLTAHNSKLKAQSCS